MGGWMACLRQENILHHNDRNIILVESWIYTKPSYWSLYICHLWQMIMWPGNGYSSCLFCGKFVHKGIEDTRTTNTASFVNWGHFVHFMSTAKTAFIQANWWWGLKICKVKYLHLVTRLRGRRVFKFIKGKVGLCNCLDGSVWRAPFWQMVH